MRNIFAILATVALFYFNVDALSSTLGLRFKPIIDGSPGHLPNHWTFSNLFKVFDVFDRWSTTNYGFRAYGSFKHYDTMPILPTENMVDLNVYDYFPQILGEANRKIWLQPYRRDYRKLTAVYPRLATMVQRLYNEKHPEKPVIQTFIYRYEWPKSPLGHYQEIGRATIYTEGHN